MSKKSSNGHEDVETPTNGYRGGNLKRRTFAKGAGTSLALASTLGAMGTGAAETHDDDDSPGDDAGHEMGQDTQFRQMNKELYVAALAATQDENGGLGEDNQNGGAGVAVFEAPEGPPDDPGASDDAPGTDDDGPGASDDAPGTDDDGPGASDDAPGTDEHEVDSLDYHVFIMDADNVGRVTINDNTSDEEVEELADLSQDADDDNDVGDDDNDVGDDDNDVGDDDNDVGDDDMGQGVSGTIEEPIVVAGSLGQGAMDSDLGEDDDDDDDDDPVQDNGEFDLEDFRRNPWDYYVAVHGDDEDDNGLTDDNDEDNDNGLTDDNDEDNDNGLTDDNDNESEAMLRGRVTTGLLEGEEEPGDRVDDDDDDVGVDDDDDDDVGVDDDDDDDVGVDDDDDDDVGVDDDDDDNGIGDDDDDDDNGIGDDDDDDDNGGLFD